MKNSYIDSYNELKFSEEEKNRMKARLVERASQELADGQVAIYRPKRHANGFAAAAALLLACFLGLGGVAYATGNWENLTRFFGGVFEGDVADTEIIEHIGHPVDVSATDDGLTISVEAVMGDRYSYAIIYSLEKEDGTPFEHLEAVEDHPYLPYSLDPGWAMPAGLSLITSGADGAAGECYFYDADPSDPSIQYVEKHSLMSTRNNPNIIGQTVEANFTELRYFDDVTGDEEAVAQGRWDLRFKIDYEDMSRQVPVHGEHIDLAEGQATITELYISPLTLRFLYVADEAGAVYDEPSGQMSEEMSSEMSRLLDFGEFTFTMKDGSTYTEEDHAGGGIDDDGVTCEKTQFLYTMLDLDELASITIGGTIFELA